MTVLRPEMRRVALIASLTNTVAARVTDHRVVVVALAGPVCSGKSTLAATVCDALMSSGLRAEALSTDGFLRTTAELRAAGLFERKGFPETYNVAQLQGAIASIASRQSTTVPVYSHSTFDPDDRRIVDALDVVIVEGVNALQPDIAGLADVRWYLDAPDDVVIEWYVHRFHLLTDASKTGGGFYAQFLALSAEQLDAFAREVWTGINQPNLDRYIRPTMANADTVIDAQVLRH
jgi:type I pantothenate kinase